MARTQHWSCEQPLSWGLPQKHEAWEEVFRVWEGEHHFTQECSPRGGNIFRVEAKDGGGDSAREEGVSKMRIPEEVQLAGQLPASAHSPLEPDGSFPSFPPAPQKRPGDEPPLRGIRGRRSAPLMAGR